jgi:hypothetical protein
MTPKITSTVYWGIRRGTEISWEVKDKVLDGISYGAKNYS